ncbi:MAG: redoxin domain-containing protein [Candidatus Symbiobacter sp.]|nr:redoxin domain-containing protein [Candidatus Symbiobacter sp.]
MRRNLWVVIPVLTFMLVGVGLFLGLRHDPQNLPSNLLGRAAPRLNLPLYAAPGAVPGAAPGSPPATPAVSSAAGMSPAPVAGGKAAAPLVVNFFASWCVPCRAEAGTLLALRQKRDEAGLGLRIIGIVYKDTPANIARYLKDYGNPYDQILVDGDGQGGIEFGVYGIPETFLIDQGGVIRHRYAGVLSLAEDVPAILKKFGKN